MTTMQLVIDCIINQDKCFDSLIIWGWLIDRTKILGINLHQLNREKIDENNKCWRPRAAAAADDVIK